MPLPDELAGLLGRATGAAHPEDALRAIVELRGRLHELEGEQAGRWLQRGATWKQIAGALGISRQAAHQRHRGSPTTTRRRHAPMSSVLVTGQARLAVRLARHEARMLGAGLVGTEHVLLGVVRSREHRAARVLDELGFSLDDARAAAQPTLVADGPAKGSASDRTMTRYARSVLEQSLREAVGRGEGYIGVEHLLLALLREEHGGAARTLREMGIDPDEVRRRLAGPSDGYAGAERAA